MGKSGSWNCAGRSRVIVNLLGSCVVILGNKSSTLRIPETKFDRLVWGFWSWWLLHSDTILEAVVGLVNSELINRLPFDVV
jgi:hypothetical protein